MYVSCMYSKNQWSFERARSVVSCLLILSGVETLKSFFVKRFFLKCFLYSDVYMCNVKSCIA